MIECTSCKEIFPMENAKNATLFREGIQFDCGAGCGSTMVTLYNDWLRRGVEVVYRGGYAFVHEDGIFTPQDLWLSEKKVELEKRREANYKRAMKQPQEPKFKDVTGHVRLVRTVA